MKKILLLVSMAVLGICAASCYDDSAISTRIDGLEQRVEALEQMNADLQAIKTLVEALQNEVYITSVTPTANGYDIVLSNGKTISLKNGDKGQTGPQGPQGQTGPQGPQGQKGDTPEIGVVLVDGVYYWAVGGQAVTDAAGNKIPVHAAAPKLKLDEGDWYVSYDEGKTWEKLAATGSSETGFFSDVQVGASSVIFTLMNGSTFELPLGNGFSLELAENVACLPGKTAAVSYVITGVANPVIYTLADGGYTSSIQKETATTGYVLVTAKEDNAEGQVLVFASNNIKTLVKSITLSKGELIVKDAFTVDAEGGSLEIEVETNLEYTAKSCVDWITIVSTKAELRHETFTATVAANPSGSPERSGEIDLCGLDGSVLRQIAIIQRGDGSLVIGGYLYPTFEAQTIDPFEKFSNYVAGGTTTADWITVQSDGKLALAQNDGLIRMGYVKYGSKSLCIIQNPGRAFLDLSFEKASGDLASKNQSVQNVGTACKLESGPTTYFYAYKCADQGYSKPVTVIDDEVLGHKVASFHNTQCPSSYGSVLWRNANGSTVKSLYDGFTVEIFTTFNANLWATTAVKDSESNCFVYKSTAAKSGNKAFCIGVIGDSSARPVVTAIMSGKRNTTTYALEDGKYYHIVLTYDPATKEVLFYVNGELVHTGAETRDISTILEVGSESIWWGGMGTNVNNPWVLGGYLNGEWQTPNSCWNGNVAACRVYASILSGSEIAQSYRVISTPLSE